MTSLPDVTKDPDVTIPVEGEQVAATRFSPSANEDALPAILWTTPYHKERERFMRYGTIFHYVAAHGYEVILANLVGTGASTGQFAGLLTPEIGNQCHTIVDWIADQPWTTG
ncbi:MAG: CocE/NonD family hydrolase, partial [Halobacteriaceae archaeon]